MVIKKYFLLAVLSVVFLYNVVAQTTAPEITRILVDETGGVTLFWIPNADVADFDHSEVWYQQEYVSGFNKIPNSENIDYATSYYGHTEAQANNRQTTYYVVNHNNTGEEFKSENVSAIYLKACFASEKIQLNWNRMHSSWTDHAFHIYLKAGTDAPWQFVDSTYNTSYQAIPAPGYQNYSYKVYYKAQTDATASVSNITNPISFSDHQPVTPSITSINIEPDGSTTINWEPSSSTNIVDYIIYLKKETDGWEELGRTNSPDILSWLDQKTTLDDCETLRTYAIAAVDNCGETGTNYPDSSKSTLVFYAPEYEICDKEVKLRWQPYESMSVTRYELYVSDDAGNNFIKYADFAAATEYSYADFQTGNYCFKINAVHERDAGETPQVITSCTYCLDVYFVRDPDPSFFRHVSVKDNKIHIAFEVDTTAILPKYRIERSETGYDDTYNVIATLAPTGATVISFIDADPDLKTQEKSYHYLLHTIDSCGTIFPAEQPAQSILLKAEEDKNHQAIIEWNDYDGYLYGLDRYVLHRYINNELDNAFAMALKTNSFTDVSMLLEDQTLSFAYRITAISNADETGKCDTSYSNIAPLKRQQSDIRFPNAFTPAGNNRIFRPIYSGLEVETYEFTIFNRYGGAIYQTTEPGGGWDGKINGNIAASGGYGYMLKIKLKNGDRIERRGSVLLLH